MLDFMRPERTLPLTDFIAREKNPIKSAAFESLFDEVHLIFKRINLRYGTGFDQPIIKVSNETFIDAQCMNGLIEISAGLIDHCMAVEAGPIENIIDNPVLSENFDYHMISKVALTWILAHEYFHIVRRHTAVLDEVGHVRRWSHAMEHDADLCATAEIYRTFQQYFGPTLPDLEIRKLAFYCLFWSLRLLPVSDTEDTHLMIEERLWHMLTKLMSLSEDPRKNPDNNMENPKSLERLAPLAEIAVKCENALAIRNGANPAASTLKHKWKELIAGACPEVVISWDGIKEEVTRISTTRAS